MTLLERNYRSQKAALVNCLRRGLPSLVQLPEYFAQRYVADKKLRPLVQVYALPLFQGFGNGKTAPAFQILLDIEEETRGNFPKVLVIPSSGNTLANIAHMVAWFRPGTKIVGVVEESISPGKIGQIRKAKAGVKIIKVGPGVSTIKFARDYAKTHGYYFVNQYCAKGSVRGHTLFTWPHVAIQLAKIDVVPSFACLALGTTSAFVSAHCLKRTWPDFQVVGAACNPGEIIPGARTLRKLEATRFGYKKLIGDRLVMCSAQAAEKMSDALHRHASLSAGPSTGMAVDASFTFINRGGVSLMNSRGKIPVLILGMDAGAPYYADRA